jgi:hypothetical protein
MATPMSKLRCITCHKDYDPQDKAIYSQLAAFEEWCVCQECVDSCQKRGTPPKPQSGD